MSYDLNFWKYKEGISLNHQKVYEELSNGNHVEGLENLPINKIIARIENIFSQDWTKLDDFTWESEKGTFQLYTTPQFFRVDCYEVDGEEMNKFIDIGAEFGCPLYDPQVGQRYEGSRGRNAHC